MPKIFDCFQFYNELELLELRLNELNDVVDFFVLVEATVTNRGIAKPLYFRDNRDRYAPFLHKIIHVVVDDMPDRGDSEPARWVRENFQRQAILRGLGSARWRDFVIVTDLDEIPRAAAVERIAREAALIPTRYEFEMRMFWYYLNLEHTEIKSIPGMARRAHLIDANQFRLFGKWLTPRHQPKRLAKTIKYFGSPMRWRVVPDAGWHFTFMNGAAAVRDKLFNYVHVVPDEHNTLAAAQTRIANAISGPEFTIRDLDARFPAYLRANRERFGDMIIAPADPAA